MIISKRVTQIQEMHEYNISFLGTRHYYTYLMLSAAMSKTYSSVAWPKQTTLAFRDFHYLDLYTEHSSLVI